MPVQSNKALRVTIIPEVEKGNLDLLKQTGEDFSKSIGKSLQAITTIGKGTKEFKDSGKALVGFLVEAGEKAGMAQKEIEKMMVDLNTGLGNGRQNYFTTQTEAIKQMAKAYERLQKAKASGDADAVRREAGNMTRWANAYQGTQGGRLASTNPALVEGFGSADAVKEMARIVREVNGGKSQQYGKIDLNKYSAEVFRKTAAAIEKAERSRMNMQYLVGQDYLKTVKIRQGKPSDVIARESAVVDQTKGRAIDLNKTPQRQGKQKVSQDALQHRVDQIEGRLDKAVNQLLNDKANNIDQAVDAIYGKGNRQAAMNDIEEYTRITGNRKRYLTADGDRIFEDLTPDKGGKTLKQVRKHWDKAAYQDKYVRGVNQQYANFLKEKGMDRVDLSMAPDNFGIPEKLKEIEQAAQMRLQNVQNYLDQIVKLADEQGLSVDQLMAKMPESEMETFRRNFGQFVGLGGNEGRYQTLGGDNPFRKYITPQMLNYWKGKGLDTKTFREGIMQQYDAEQDRQAALKRQSIGRQEKRGQHYVQPKTKNVSQAEEERYIASLVQKQIEDISKSYVPKGNTGTAQRKDLLEQKLLTAFGAAKKANQEGYGFSVSGAYGVGNDAQIRSDYYEWLALGGNPELLSWGQDNPFTADWWNAMKSEMRDRQGNIVRDKNDNPIMESTQQIRGRWRHEYQDNSRDGVKRRQDWDKYYERMYASRTGALQKEEKAEEELDKEKEEVRKEEKEHVLSKKQMIARMKQHTQKQAAKAEKKEVKEEKQQKEEQKAEQKVEQKSTPTTPTLSPRQKRIQDLQKELQEKADTITAADKEYLDKWSEYRALGGDLAAIKNSSGKNPYPSTWNRMQMGSNFNQWKAKVATPEYAKSIGEDTSALEKENQELQKNTQLKQQNASASRQAASASEESAAKTESETKSKAKLTEADQAAMAKRRGELFQKLGQANSNRLLGSVSQKQIDQMRDQYFEYKALGGKISDLTAYAGGKNFFEKDLDAKTKQQMESAWNKKVRSTDYLQGLQEENAALDENTSKVRENQAAKASDAENAKASANAIAERKEELQEQLQTMVEQTREQARMHDVYDEKEWNDRGADEGGFGHSIDDQISQLDRLEEQQEEAIEKWNEFRALGGQATDILGKSASDADIQALERLDNSQMIEGFKEQHGLIEEAIEDKERLAEASKEAADAQAESKADTAAEQARAKAEKEQAEALREKAEAKREASEAESQAGGTTSQSAKDAERQAESAERMAKAQQEAAEAKRQAQTVKTTQAGAESSVEAEKTAMEGLANTITGDVAQAIKTKTDLFPEEQAVVTGVVEAEKAELLGLAEVLQGDIPNAIEVKNASFAAEQDIVTSAVASEKTEIDSLAQDIQTKVPQAVKEIGRSMTEESKTFETSVTGIRDTVSQLCDALEQIAKSADAISKVNFDKLGKIVSPLGAFKVDDKVAGNLKDFSGQIQKQSTGLSDYSKNAKIDTSAISNIGSVIKPFKIDASAATNLQSFIEQLKAIKRTLKSLGSMDEGVVENISKLTTSVSNLKVNKSIGDNLQGLIAPLDQLSDALTKLSSSEISADSIQNIFSSVSSLKAGKDLGSRIESLSTALNTLKQSLSSFGTGDTAVMDSLKDFLSQASALKDVAAVIRSTQKDIQQAKNKVDIATGQKTEDQVKEEKKQAEKKVVTSDTESTLTRAQAVKKYSESIKELLTLEAKREGLEAQGKTLNPREQQKLEDLRKVIDATKEYIDVENKQYKQETATAQGKATTEQTRANAVAKSVQEAQASAEKMRAAYEVINTQLANPESMMGQAQGRLNLLQASNIQGISDKIGILRQKVTELNESFALGMTTESGYAQELNKLLKPYEKATAVLTNFSREEAQARIRQNLITSAAQRGGNVREGDVRFSGTTNMTGSVRFTNRKGQTEILTQNYDAQTEALGKMNQMYATTKTSADKFFDSLKSHGRSLVTYMATFVSFYRVVGVFKDMISQIKQFDTALTEMRKVSDESIDRLKSFQQESFGMAEQIGTTAQQIQESTADFLRLGQEFDKAKESAMNANILFNVSEFDSIDDATTSLIAMTQAYKDVDQTHIIDSLNRVGNDFSISTSGLAEALQRSASALTTSGNSLEESIGMITAANQVVQNPENVGAAMKIISLRLAGQKQQIEDMGEDTEGMVTTVSKLRTGIMNATKVASNGMKGVDIEDANGNLKNTYTILQDISDIWEQIGEQDKLNGTNQQNYLLQTMAGKNRSNVLASLLQSPDVLRSAYQEALDSEGSAMVENQKYLESVEGHMQRIKNEASEFAYNFMSSDGLKGVIDLGTQFLKLLNDISSAIGSFSTLGLMGSGIFGLKGLFNGFKEAKGLAAKNQQIQALRQVVAQGGTSQSLLRTIRGNVFYDSFTAKDKATILGDTQGPGRSQLEVGMGIQQLGQQAENAKGSVVGLGGALKGAFSGANLIPSIVTLTTLFISLGTAIYNSYKKAKEAKIQNASQLAGQFKDTSSDIESQIESYTKLSESLNKANITEQETARIKSQLLDIQNSLSESYGKQVQGIDLVNGSLDDEIEKLQEVKRAKAKEALSQAGARGQSKGDFKYAYDEMTRRYEFHPGAQRVDQYDSPNVSGNFNIFGGSGSLPRILDWAKQFENQGLVVDEFGILQEKKMTATGTAQQILDLLKLMGDNLQNIEDYDEIKDTGNFKTLNDWINEATQHYQKIVDEYSDDFMQYLSMKLLADERHGIDYSFGGKEYQNKDLGGFYYRFQSAADAYSKALEGSDEGAIEDAKAEFEAMRDAWTNKIAEMHDAGDDALDDYQLLMDGVVDSISTNAINAYNLSKEYKSQNVTPFKHWAGHITDHGISSTDFESAAKTQGIQKGEYYVNRVLQEALNAGYMTDITDTSQIDWLITQMQKLGIFADSAAKSGKKAEGTYASFLESIADTQDDKSIGDTIDELQSKSSSLEGWVEKLSKGEVDRAGLVDLFQEFPDLASNMQFVQSVTDNMNAEGFVQYTQDMKSAITDLNFKSAISAIQKMNQELADQDSYDEMTRNAIRAQRDILINSLDLSDISTSAVNQKIFSKDTQFKEGQQQKIRMLLRETTFRGGEYGAEVVARLLLDDQSATWDYEQWKERIESQTVKVELEAPVKQFKKSVEATQSMMDKNAKITSFEESLDSGKAKAEDLLSLISTYPTEFEAISDTVSKVLSGENIDGTIDGAKELSGVLAHIRVDNLEDSLANAENDIQRIIAYSQADLSGISKEDATRLISQDERGYNIAGKTKEDLLDIVQTGDAVKRQAAVLALGMQISFTDAMEIVQNQLEQTEVSAIKTFDSMSDSIDSFKEKVASDTATPDDVLGLVETFPELLEYTDVLGQAFSNLSMSGALSDASQLEQILTQIQQKKLAEYLKENKIKDQDIVQGMARQIDFSSISKEDADEYVKRIKNQYGLDLSQYDTSTAEGRDIIGHINFVVEHAQVTDLKGLVDDSVNQGASDGLKKAMSDMKALDSAASSLNDYMNKALSGELAASDLDSIYESFGDLITDGSQLDALYSSLNMEGFVSDAETAVALINELKIAKLQKFIDDQKEAGTLTREAQRSMVNQTRLTGATEDEARAAAQILSTNKNVDMGQIQRLYEQGKYSAIIRLSLYPEIQNADEFQSDLDAAVEAYTQDVSESVKVGVDIVSEIGSSNASIDDFTDKLKDNEATSDDLLSLLKDAPKAAEEAGAELSKMLDNPNADGTLKNIEGVNEALAHLKYENIEKGVDEVARLNDLSQDAQALLRKSAFSTADLSGISATDADEIVSKYADSDQKLHDMANSANQLEREAAAVAAGMGVSFEQAFSIVETRAEKAKISAVQSFKSMGDEIAQFSEKAANNEVTSDDVLGLIETFPELLGQTDVLSDAFSQLSLDGVVSDASTLQSILASIAQMRLSEMLQKSGITDPNVIAGLANTLDFSGTSKKSLQAGYNYLNSKFEGLEDVDLGTKQGRNIMGRIQYTINAAGGLENIPADVIQQIIHNAVAQGTADGVADGLQQVQNLGSAMSTLNDATSKIMSGEFSIDDVASLEETFSELNLTGEDLNSIYSSIGMDGFVQDAKTANSLVNKLKTEKISKFFEETEGLTAKSKRSLLSATRLTGIGKAEGKSAYEQLKERSDVDQRRIQQLYERRDYDALVRINLIPEYENGADFNEAAKAAVEASKKDELPQIQMDLEVITNLQASNAKITDFVNGFSNGQASVDSLIGLLQEVPEVALNSGDAIAEMIKTADFDGTITSIDGLSKAASSFTLENLNKQFKQIKDLPGSKELKQALRGYMVDMADLSGTTDRDVSNALKQVEDDATREKLTKGWRTGKYSNEATMRVILKGEVDASDVDEKIDAQAERIAHRELIADVNARLNFSSDASSIKGLIDEIDTGDITVDSALSLAQTMPEILDQATELGYEFTDMNMDGVLDDAEQLRVVLSNVQAQKLWKFVQNQKVSRAGKLTAIANTALGNISLQEAQRILGENAQLVEQGLTTPVTREAAVKAKLSLDAQGIKESAENYHEMFQNAMDGYVVDINFRNATDMSQRYLDQIGSIGEQMNSLTAGKSVPVADYNLKELEDYKGAIEYTANSIQYNYTKVRQLNKAKAEQAKATNNAVKAQKEADYAANADEIKRLTAELASNTFAEGENATSVTAHINKLLNDNAIIQDNITQLQLMNAAIDESISKYQAWQNAQSAPESGDMFDDTKTMWQELADAFNPDSDTYQKYGTQKFKTAADFLMPDDADTDPAAIKEWQENTLKRYLTFDDDGKTVKELNLGNFMNDMVDKGFAQIDQNGNYRVLGEHTMQQIADGMNLGVGFVEAAFGEMNEYIFNEEDKFKFDDTERSFSNIMETATKASNALEALDGEEVKVDVTGLDKQDAVSQLESTIQQMQDKKIQPDVDTSQIEYANEVIASCVVQLAQLNQPVVMQIDTSQLSQASQEDGTAQAINDLQALYNANTNREIAIQTKADTSEADAEIDALVEKIQGEQDTMLKLGLEVDGASAEEILNQLQEQDGTEYKAIVNIEDNATSELESLADFKIGDKKFSVIAVNLSATMNNVGRLNAMQIEDKKFTVLCPGLPTVLSQLSSIASRLAQLDGKVVTATVNVNRNSSGGGADAPIHTALGTAFASGTALAGGRDFTVGRNEVSLVNEVGQESRVHNGVWELLPGGPHLQKLDKDDIVFNAQQTQDLLKSGKTARQGKVVAPSNAKGTFASLDKKTLPAFAKGTANDLVGEKGIEMYVDPKEGKWHTVGESGPEFVDLPKGAIVFNNEQTKDLLTKGQTDTHATLAHVDGTVDDIDLSEEDFIYNPMDESEEGDSFLNGNAFLSGNAYERVPSGTLNGQIVQNQQKTESKAKSDGTKATKDNTKATKDNTKSKKKEGQVFDWVASRLSYLADQTAKFADAITDFISYEDKLVNLVGKASSAVRKNSKGQAVDSTGDARTGQHASLIQEIKETQSGAARYKKQAASVKNPYEKPGKSKAKKNANAQFEEYKKMINSGYKIDIDTIADEKLATQVKEYQKWMDLSTQASNNVDNLKRSLVELYNTWANAPAEEAEKQIERLTKGLNGLEAAEARLDAVMKGGSTQSALDKILGKGASGSYTNLGSAGLRAVKADNANKTAYYQKAYDQRVLQSNRVATNTKDFKKLTGISGVSDSGKIIKTTSSNSAEARKITMQQIKQSGKEIANKYKKGKNKLTKKQRKALEKGQTVKVKGVKNKKAKAEIKKQNALISQYQRQPQVVQAEGTKIANKYSKKLSAKQKASLQAGNTIKLTKKQKKNKKLAKKVKAYNKKAKNKLSTSSGGGGGSTVTVSGQQITGEAMQGFQSFVDAINSADTDKVVSAAELAAQKVQEIRDNFDYINEAYETQIEYQENLNKLNEQSIEDAETFGNSVTAGMRDRQKQNAGILKNLAQHEADSLQKELDAGVSSGTIVKGSKEWIEMTQNILKAKQSVHDYDVQIKQMELKKLDDIQHHYETQISYLESMRKLNEQNVADAEKFGDQVTSGMRDQQKRNVSGQRAKKAKEADSLEKQLAASVANGTVKEGSLEWLTLKQKVNEAKSAVHDYDVEMKELEIKKLQDITDHYGKIVDYLQSVVDLNNVWNDRDEAIGNYKKAEYYTKNISENQAIANKKMEEARKEQQEFNKQVREGTFVEGTDSYIQQQAEINKLWKEGYDAQVAVSKLSAEYIQFQIDGFNKILEKQQEFISNLNTMGGLINDAAKWDYDTGNLTEQGQLSMTIDKESYNSALADIQSIAQQKDRLLKELQTNVNYGQEAYDEDIKELTSKQMQALQSAKSSLESFTKTVETTAQKQLAALNKVIDKRKEALQKEQDYYNYDKQLKSANKDIALLEAQSRALEGVSDAESKAKKARIDAQLAQKRDDLKDTTREHAVSLQTEGLSQLQTNLQENYERWSQQFEADSQRQLAVMQSTNMTSQQMASTMNNMLASFGTNMTQMGLEVSAVNAATTAAVTGVSGQFMAFTQDTAAVDVAKMANDDLQEKEKAAWNGELSDGLVGKLAETWTTLTTSGQATIVENMMLDETGDNIANNLVSLEDVVTDLPPALEDPINGTSDTIDEAVGTLTASISSQTSSVTGTQAQVQNAVNTNTNVLAAGITSIIQAIGDAAASIGSADANAKGEADKGGKKGKGKKGKAKKSKGKGSKSGGNKTKTKKNGSVKKKKRLGTMSINKDDIYMTQENGGEIITTKDGVLIPLKAGDGVIPAQLTEKLFEMAREYPSSPVAANLEVPNLVSSGAKTNLTVTYGSLLTVNGNVDKEILPDLQTILRESYDYTQKKLAQDARKGGMRKSY